MLVRADLFVALDGFDQDAFPGSEDLDLCWRARLAGARVLVVPDARVRHRSQSSRAPGREPARRPRARTSAGAHAVHVLLVRRRCSGSCPSGSCRRCSRRSRFLFTPPPRRGVRRSARVVVEHAPPRATAPRSPPRAVAAHDPRLRAPRAPARLVGAGALVPQPPPRRRADGVDGRPAARGCRLARRGAAPSRQRSPSSPSSPCSRSGRARSSPRASRRSGRSCGWTGTRSMLDAFGSAWHYTGLGAPKPASGALAGMAALTAATLNHPGLAQTLLVVGRLRGRAARRGAAGASARRAARPGDDRRDPLRRQPRGRATRSRTVASARWCCSRSRRSSCRRSSAPSGFGGITDPGHRVRATFGVGVFTAIAVAFFPPAALFLALLVGAFLVGSILLGSRRRGIAARRADRRGRRDRRRRAAAAVVDHRGRLPHRSARRSASRSASPTGRSPTCCASTPVRRAPGYATWGLYAAAFFALVVASGPRLAWVARAWFLAAGGLAAVYVPSQLWPNASVPAPEGALVAGRARARGRGRARRRRARRRAAPRPLRLASARRRRSRRAGIALVAVGFAADSHRRSVARGHERLGRQPVVRGGADVQRAVPHPLDRRPGRAADRSLRGARRHRLRVHRRRSRRRTIARPRAEAGRRRRREARGVARARRPHEPPGPASSRRWACATSRCRRATAPTVHAARRSRGCGRASPTSSTSRSSRLRRAGALPEHRVVPRRRRCAATTPTSRPATVRPIPAALGDEPRRAR